MKDKLGQELEIGDWVLSAKNGPYLYFGKILKYDDTGGRSGVTIEEIFQEENNPNNPFISRIQTINSPHRLVKINPLFVPDLIK